MNNNINVAPYTRTVRTVQLSRIRDNCTYTEFWIIPKNVIIATGSRPRHLAGLKVDGEKVFTSDEFLTLEQLPKSLVIIGGGVIGVEWASMLIDFEVDVTILEAGNRLIPTEDEAISDEMYKQLTDDEKKQFKKAVPKAMRRVIQKAMQETVQKTALKKLLRLLLQQQRMFLLSKPQLFRSHLLNRMNRTFQRNSLIWDREEV